ncbi:hypothetical protein KBB96_02300 [Luteolibacter ambystomatis]|uniref:Uncharacterized protein n=1 Tax=Luteolibacter ambystomatis TaxID=2824561 RepID=A0A975PF72_9BACT|nr:hypothetical protein [Luteolibacter ambystomatis]QUE51730.1 hypothetical protein KBB96_02300 [Luteolibacter ambystomatis]
MNDDLHDIEACLASLRPAVPDSALLARLEQAAHGSLVRPTAEEMRMEALLGGHEPLTLPPDLMRSLEGIVANAPFHVDEKIVMFTKPNAAPAPVRRYRPMAAAAAVALLGGLTALMMPAGKAPSTGPVRVAGSPVTSNDDRVAPASFSPSGYGRDVQDAKDEGVIWKNGRPYRVMRATFKEKASFTNSEGRKVEFEQPREELILVPEKID